MKVRNVLALLLFSVSMLLCVNTQANLQDPAVSVVDYPVVPVGNNLGEYRDESVFLADYLSPLCNYWKKHLGEDWNVVSNQPWLDPDLGDPIYPIASGTVVYVRNVSAQYLPGQYNPDGSPKKDTIGKMVIIRHTLPSGQEIYSVYMHLEDVYVSLGQQVYRYANLTSSTNIGTIGDANGNYAGGAHLHFEIRQELSIPYGATDAAQYNDIVSHQNPYVVDINDPQVLGYINPTVFIQSYQQGQGWFASVPLKQGWNRVRWQYASGFSLNGNLSIVKGMEIQSLPNAADNGLISHTAYEFKHWGEWKQFTITPQSLAENPEKHVWIYAYEPNLILATNGSGWKKFQIYDAGKVTDNLKMRSYAGTSASIVKSLTAGDFVTITEEGGINEGIKWWKAIASDGSQGWIAQNWVEYSSLAWAEPQVIPNDPPPVGGCPECDPYNPVLPNATILSPTNVSITTAGLRGDVNPNGYNTNYWFQWGATMAYGNETSHLNIGADTNIVSVPTFNIVGLTCSNTYHVRMLAENDAGTVASSDLMFQSEACGLYAPANLRIEAATPDTMRIRWTDTSTNEEAFKIERRTPGNTVFEHRYYQYPNMEVWIDQWPPFAFGEHCYRVKAIRSGVPDSGYSNIACATIRDPNDVVYGDSLASNWGDWSWSTTTVRGVMLEVNYQAPWAGLHLHVVNPSGFSTVGKNSLTFIVNGGAQGGQNLIVHLYDINQVHLGTVYLNDYVSGGTLLPNTNHSVKIPLSDLSAVDAILDRIIIQYTDSSPTTVMFDDIVIGAETGSSATPEIVYANNLANNWGDWSWSTDTVHGVSLQVAYQSQWAGLHLHVTDQNGVSTVRRSKLSFTINGGAQGGQDLMVHLYNISGVQLGSVYVNSYIPGGTLFQNTDYNVSIPLSDLNATNTTLDRIIIQNVGSAPTTVTFDNIVIGN